MTNPHDLQERLDSALSALNCMTDQRDQLAARLKDATAQLARAGDLLREAHADLTGGVCEADVFAASVADNIDAYLKGEVLPPVAPEGWQLVPVEPTNEMIKAGVWAKHNLDGVGRIYDTMLEAAPKPEGK